MPDPFDAATLRSLVPAVIGVLVRRGADFATAEDAVQEALVEAVRSWPDDPPRDPKGWLVTVAWRRFLDVVRSETARSQPSTSTTYHPAMRSLVSANGPSVTGCLPWSSARTHAPSGDSACASTYSPFSSRRLPKASMN